MKNVINYFVVAIFITFLAGCTTAKQEVSKTESKTSKQVEKELNWKYCEESK